MTRWMRWSAAMCAVALLVVVAPVRAAVVRALDLGQLTEPVTSQVANHLQRSRNHRFSPHEFVTVWAGANDLFMQLFQALGATCFHQLAGFAMSRDGRADLIKGAGTKHELPGGVGENHHLDWPVGDAANCFQQLLTVTVRNTAIDDDDA